MPKEILFFMILVLFSGTLSLLLGVYSCFRLKGVPGGRFYTAVTFLAAFFTFAYAFELSSSSLEEIKFWMNAEYLAMPFIPVFTLLMCLEYSGLRLRNWHYYALFLVPSITLFMHTTNTLHHLYYTSVGLREASSYPLVTLEWGPFFYLHAIFLFFCLIFSIVALLMQLPKAKPKFQIQIWLMTAGLIVPIVANHFYLNGLSPEGIDLGPVSLSLSFLLHGAALLFFQMFNAVPIARDAAFESVRDGLLVVNMNGMIVDCNAALKEWFPSLKGSAIGKKAENLLNGELAGIVEREEETDYKLFVNGKTIHLQIRFSPVLTSKGDIAGRIITFADVTVRVQLQEELQRLASIDGLTQAYNRTFFLKQSGALVQYERPLSVILFDIDHFKKVNDTFGHDAGDRVLISVAGLVKGILGNTGILGRYGGEEFCITLPDQGPEEAFEISECIRKALSAARLPIEDAELLVTSSFGVAGVESVYEGFDFNSLVKSADKALYSAKRKGRNCVEIAG